MPVGFWVKPCGELEHSAGPFQVEYHESSAVTVADGLWTRKISSEKLRSGWMTKSGPRSAAISAESSRTVALTQNQQQNFSRPRTGDLGLEAGKGIQQQNVLAQSPHSAGADG